MKVRFRIPVRGSSRPILVAVLLFFLGDACSQAEISSFKIGEQVIQLPAPAGFLRSDGLNPEFDQDLTQKVGSFKLLAFYCDQRTNELLAAKSSPGEMVYFFAGYSESENVDSSEQVFNKEVAKAKEEINSLAIFKSGDLRDAQGNVDQVVKELGGQGQIQVGKPKILGVLEETANSLVFATIKATVAMTLVDSTEANCSIMSFSRVANRIVFLSCSAPYKSPEDLKSAFSLFEPWRDEILRLNPNNPEQELAAATNNAGQATEVPEARSQTLSTIEFVFGGLVVITGIRLFWRRMTNRNS